MARHGCQSLHFAGKSFFTHPQPGIYGPFYATGETCGRQGGVHSDGSTLQHPLLPLPVVITTPCHPEAWRRLVTLYQFLPPQPCHSRQPSAAHPGLLHPLVWVSHLLAIFYKPSTFPEGSYPKSIRASIGFLEMSSKQHENSCPTTTCQSCLAPNTGPYEPVQQGLGLHPYTKKRKSQFGNPKAPRSFEISNRNLREVVGLGQTRVQPGSEFGERDQGQGGGQHVPV